MRVKRIISVSWLPILLTALLVIETLLFNSWLGVASPAFVERCIAASVGLSMVLFFSAVFFTKRSTRYVYVLATSLVVAIIFIAQFVYYKYSGGFLQGSSLAYSDQTVDLLADH